MRDACLRRLVFAHLFSAIGEWAVTVGLLVHAFRWGGAPAVGVFSIGVLLSPLVSTPLVGAAMARRRPHLVRVGALAVQGLAYGGAATMAVVGAPTPAVAPFVVVGLAATTAIHPTGAALLPRIARSADDLVSAYVWVGHCDSASALVGSLAAGVIVGAGGPEAVFAVAAAGAVAALGATLWRPAPLTRSAAATGTGASRGVIRRALVELRERPWSRGVLAISCARNLVVGAFDVLLVVVALDVLGLGDGGPGYLSALVGAGALGSTVLVATAVRRSQLRGALMSAVVAASVLAVGVGLWTEAGVVYVVLPLMGVCMAAMEALIRTLLQRSSDPRRLGSMFAALGFVAGLGQLAGSAMAQVGLAVGGPSTALVVLGGVLVALAALSVSSLRRADAHTEIPSIEMALLAGVPVFSSLPAAGLEQVARVADPVVVAPGASLMVEGDPGSECFVVASGEFEVTMSGHRRRVLSRGDAVGELALLTDAPRTSTVTALGAGSVLRIDRDSFLLALTGYDVGAAADVPDYAIARERYRDVVAAHDRDPQLLGVDRAESWLGLGAAGRLLGDASFRDAIRRGVSLAADGSNDALLAHAAAMTTWPGSFFFVAENPDVEMIDLCEQTLRRLGPEDPMRVRVLATLASHATFAYDRDHLARLIAEAAHLAARHHDPALVGSVLNAEYICLWEPSTCERRQEIAASLTEIGVRTGDATLEFLGGFFAAFGAAECARLDEAREQLVALRASYPRTRIEYFEFICERLLLSIDIARGEPGVMERVDALAERHGPTYADTDGTWALQIGGLAHQAGTLGGMRSTIESMIEGPHSRTWRAALALSQLVDGDREAATSTLAEQGDVPKNYFWVTVTQVQAEVVAALGQTDRCQFLFDELAPYRGRVGITASGSLVLGLVSRSLGELAIALGRADDAVDLLTEAVADADRNRMPFEAVVSRRLLAAAYVARGDHAASTRIVAEAEETARERGFARELALLGAVSTRP